MNLDIPFYKLPETVKHWARNNGFVIRETATSAVTCSNWRIAYQKAH